MVLHASQMACTWAFQCMENDDEQLPLVPNSSYLLFYGTEEGSLDRKEAE